MVELDKSTLKIKQLWCNRYMFRDHTSLNKPMEERQVIGISWTCNLGYGEYELSLENDGTRIVGYSEYMDSGEDKEFLKALFEKILEKVEIES